MKARKQSDPIKKMTPKTTSEGIASANLRDDKMSVARSAIRTSSSEAEVMDKLKKGFSEIKPDSTIRGGHSGHTGHIIDKRPSSTAEVQREKLDKYYAEKASAEFKASLNKKGSPPKARKKKLMFQDGGKTPKSVKKEDKAVAKSVDGSRYPSWLNPKNWGVTDYSHYKTQDKAYVAARKAGEKEFMWNGKRFNTLNSGTSQQQFDMYKNTDKLINAKINEDTKKVMLTDAVFNRKVDAEYLDRRLTLNQLAGSPNYEHTSQNRSQKLTTLRALGLANAETKKTTTGDKEWRNERNIRSSYSSLLNKIYGHDYIDEEAHGYRNTQEGSESLAWLRDYIKDPYITKEGQLRGYSNKEHFEFDTHNVVEPVLREYIRGVISEEEIPKYIELRRNNKDKLRFPNNIFYLPYSDKSDKSSIKKLQHQLYAKGYKLPKSTKEDGSFDGVWGDETKAALLDYQTKNKKYGGVISPEPKKKP